MSRLRPLLVFALTVVCLVGQNRLAFPQILTGDILGTVTDTSGGVVAGATVTLTEQQTNVSQTTTTDANGEYLFARLKPGMYRVDVQQKGFQSATVSDIELLVGQRPRIDVAMKVGTLGQKVEVSAGGVQLVDTQTSSMGQVIQGKPIVELPLNGRNFLQLAAISANVEPVGTGDCRGCLFSGYDSLGSNTAGVSVTVSVAGARDTANRYMLDGFVATQAGYSAVGIFPSVDSIQEFKVQTGTYSAEGGGGVGLVSTILKSGTNALHGTLYEFNRNTATDANNFFNNLNGQPNPHYVRNNYGGSVGGPVLLPHIYDGRNKTFWFFSYEGQHNTQAQSAGTGLFPSPAQLAGNLSDDSAGTGYFPTSSPFCAANPKSQKCINLINPNTGQPFANNVIPSNMLDRTAQKWLPFFPKPNLTVTPGSPNLPAANYINSPLLVYNFYNLDARGDHIISSKDQLSLTITWMNNPIVVPGITPTSGNFSPDASHMIAGTYTHSFAPTVLNQAGIGYSFSRIGSLPLGARAGINYTADVFGIKNIIGQSGCWGVPEATFSSFDPIGSSPTCFENATGWYQFFDNLSIVHGRHNFKMGASLIHLKWYALDSGTSGIPIFSFTGNWSQAPLADFLLGYVGGVTFQQGDFYQNLRQQKWAGYLQDDFRVTHNFTLNWGLRYEHDSVPFETRNQCSLFNPADGKLYLSSTGAVRNCTMDPEWNNFAPRFGFAYSPGGSGKTAFRGGFGVFYSAIQMEELEFMSQTIPGSTIRDVLQSDPSLPTPQYTFSNGTLFPYLLGSQSTFPPNSTIFGNNQRNRTPYVSQWSLNVQRQLGKNWVVDLGYLGNVGNKLLGRWNENAAAFDYSGKTSVKSRQPYPYWGTIFYSQAQGWSSYNAGSLRVERKISAGMYLLGSYTWAHALTVGGLDPGKSIASHYFKVLDKGPAQYDVRQRAVISYLLEAPFGRNRRFLSGASGAVDRLVGGWKLNGVTTFSKGNHLLLTPNLGFNNLNIGALTTSMPDVIGNPIPAHQTYTNWWNINAFATPGCPTVARCATDIHRPGNAVSGFLEQPGFQNWDLAVIKDTRMNDRLTVQLRTELFNAWNHPQWGPPDATLTDGAGNINSHFGVITSTRAPAREVQFGLKLIW